MFRSKWPTCPDGPQSMDIVELAGVMIENRKTKLFYAVAVLIIKANFRKKSLSLMFIRTESVYLKQSDLKNRQHSTRDISQHKDQPMNSQSWLTYEFSTMV